MTTPITTATGPVAPPPSPEWEARVAALWSALDDHEDEAFFAAIAELVAELPDGHPVGSFERACAFDSFGRTAQAVPLYREALAGDLTGLRRRRAVIQMSSSLRWLGHPEQSIALLSAERDLDPAALDADERELADAISAVLALALADAGREREAVSVAVAALAPHLPRYQRSMAAYARLLIDPDAA